MGVLPGSSCVLSGFFEREVGGIWQLVMLSQDRRKEAKSESACVAEPCTLSKAAQTR